MTRKCALTICVVFVGSLAALMILARLSTAERDERVVLQLAAAQLFDPSACLSILTRPNTQGGYDFDAADQGLRNTALADLDQAAEGRDVRLIAGDSGGASLDALAKSAFQKSNCASSITLETPRFYGNFAFVNMEATHWNGRMAFQRTKNGWRFLERKTSSRGLVV
jgi:hypothetical protein